MFQFSIWVKHFNKRLRLLLLLAKIIGMILSNSSLSPFSAKDRISNSYRSSSIWASDEGSDTMSGLWSWCHSRERLYCFFVLRIVRMSASVRLSSASHQVLSPDSSAILEKQETSLILQSILKVSCSIVSTDKSDEGDLTLPLTAWRAWLLTTESAKIEFGLFREDSIISSSKSTLVLASRIWRRNERSSLWIDSLDKTAVWREARDELKGNPFQCRMKLSTL